jgi:hypothetical protein
VTFGKHTLLEKWKTAGSREGRGERKIIVASHLEFRSI